MELIAHSLCIANSAPAKVARDGWPGKTALLNGQSVTTKSELHQSPDLTDAYWQAIVGLKSQIARPAKPMVICAELCPLERAVRGDTWRFSQTCPQRFADLLMKPRLSRAPIPEETKGEPIPISLNCLSTPAAQLAHISGCRASAMLSQRTSRCRLPSGKSDKKKPAHEAKHHGPPAVQPRPFYKLPKMMWGVTLLRS